MFISRSSTNYSYRMAHMYARHGANLVIGDINENQGADVEKELSTSSAK